MDELGRMITVILCFGLLGMFCAFVAFLFLIYKVAVWIF